MISLPTISPCKLPMGFVWIFRRYSLLVPIFTMVLQLGCGDNRSTAAHNFPSALHQPLPEQYIWFASTSTDSASPRFFRKSFVLTFVPAQATLYFVGPYNFDIFVNGTEISHLLLGGPVLLHDRPVVELNIGSNLRSGSNTVALAASAGDVFAIKIVPAAQGINTDALLLSDASWKGATVVPPGWERPSFDDNSWGTVQSFGSIESDFHRFQGNFDLGMYQWPGYEGLSALLDHAPLAASRVLDITSNGGAFSDTSVLTSPADFQDFRVNLTANLSPSPSLTLDFGKEISGRLEVASSSPEPVHLQMIFGESEEETSPDFSTLSVRDLIVPPFMTVHGPLTAFRFVRILFLGVSQIQRFGHIRADQELRKLPLQGSFESSDPVINQIWSVSTYTAQLGMQAVYWDAPKRDRNPFSADLYVSARTAQVAFGNTRTIRDTLNDLLRRVCNVEAAEMFGEDINCIPSYNAWWILALGDQYRFSGDFAYLKSNRKELVQILDVMTGELTQNLFRPTNLTGIIFADWSPGMIQFGAVKAPEAVEITTFVYYRAFIEAAFLLRQLGEAGLADKYQQIANNVRSAAIFTYLDISKHTFGNRTQTNAMAIFSGVSDPETTTAAVRNVLSQPPSQPVSPYFNYFVIRALAQAGYRAEALALVRQHWGSMLNAGATSFWEVYDPTCPTSVNFHACLTNFINSVDNQGTNRYFVSLAHGWASGPAAWLHEEILGIKLLTPGFESIQIRPDLVGLQWARGTEGTPKGTISIRIESRGTHIELDLPAGTDTYISLPTTTQNPIVSVNGTPLMGDLVENRMRTMIHLQRGLLTHFVLQSF